MSKKKKSNTGMLVLFGVIILVLILVLIFSFSGGGADYSVAEVDAFAQCITEQGAIMYGAFWCPHCARTKKMFGSSFQYVEYVECDPRGDNEQSERCIAEGIEEYDTWVFADGSRHISEPTFEELSAKTGCPVPGGAQ